VPDAGHFIVLERPDVPAKVLRGLMSLDATSLP
jgi:hypothetical protein